MTPLNNYYIIYTYSLTHVQAQGYLTYNIKLQPMQTSIFNTYCTTPTISCLIQCLT